MNKRKPVKGLYCPKPEDHPGSRERLLCCFDKGAIYLQCRHHDWLKIELYSSGEKMDFKNLTAVFSDIEFPSNAEKHHFDVKAISYVAKGKFKLHNRSYRNKK